MATIFDATERRTLLGRLAALSPAQAPTWGRMTAHQMVCHLIAAFESGLETPASAPATPPAGPLTWLPVKWLAIHVLPWPKGKLAAPPELLGRPGTSWEGDVATLSALVERAGARGPEAGWALSPAFGALSGKSWGVLLCKHMDHHLRQFGV